MIRILKKDGGETFDLPADYIIEAEKNNPIFEDRGSQTVPIAFPATNQNRRLLNFPYRTDNKSRPDETVDVIVECGSSQQRGLLSINSASQKTISANIGYDESAMYARFGKMQLAEISLPPALSFSEGGINQKVDAMLERLTAVMKERTEADYYVFPLELGYEELASDNGLKYKVREILNDINAGHVETGVNKGELLALENRKITRIREGELIEFTVPKGYGVSPFLKVSRVLELVFAHFDFRVKENPFETGPQLRRLVVLNNCTDSVITGELNYKDLLPDITVEDFLDALYARFGMIYFVDSNTRTVELKFLRDVLTDPQSVDFTPCKAGGATLSSSSPRQLRLKMNRKAEVVQTLYDTLPEFLDRFNRRFTDSNLPGAALASQVFDIKTSRYRIYNPFNFFASGDETTDLFSSDFFDYDEKLPDMEYEDIEMKDLCLGFSSYDLLHILAYPVGFRHDYSEILVSGARREEEETKTELAFAFAFGMTEGRDPDYFFASQINRDADGNFIYKNGVKYDISLTCIREDGLFNRFWKEYADFIRYSNREVKCELRIPETFLSGFATYRKVILDNSPLIAASLKFKLNDKKTNAEGTFRTLRPYGPVDERPRTEYAPCEYYWSRSETETVPPEAFPDNFILRSEEYLYEEKFYTVNGEQVPVNLLSCLPPTREEFDRGEERVIRFRKIYSGFLEVKGETPAGYPTDTYYVAKRYESKARITFTPRRTV